MLGRAPSAAAQAARLEHSALAPIETPYGFFRLSVDYQPAAAVHVLEQVLACCACCVPAGRLALQPVGAACSAQIGSGMRSL